MVERLLTGLLTLSLRRWAKELGANPMQALPGHGQ